ncbi:MAG: F0F1 ATP synthase subunit delta [Pseudomonadota bacterium]
MSTTTAAATSFSAQAPILTGAAGRYAEALFDLAKDAGAVDAIETDLKAIGAAIAASTEFSDFLASPVYGREDKEAAIAAFAEKAGFGELTTNFLRLVAKKGRLFAIGAMIKGYNDLAAYHRGEVRAEATSAAPLNEEQTRRLRGEIEGLVGKAVNLDTRVDPDLLGGLVVKVGSAMIDSSLRSKLEKLKNAMKEA